MNEHEVDAFAALARARPIDVRFIEFMPFDDNDWSDSKLVRRAYTPPLPPRYPNPPSPTPSVPETTLPYFNGTRTQVPSAELLAALSQRQPGLRRQRTDLS